MGGSRLSRPACAVCLATLWSCSAAPRINAASDAECAASLKRVSLAAQRSADSARYTTAIASLTGSLFFAALGEGLAEGLGDLSDPNGPSVRFARPDSAVVQGALCDALSGLSARQIVERSDSLGARVNDALERRYAQAKIRALREARDRYALIADSLAQFRVRTARLVQERGAFGLDATIVLTVENGTKHPVSRAFFNGRAVSPGRSVPWIEHSFNYTIPGGLEPGERATWRLKPSLFQGGWTSVAVPRGATLEVQVVKLEGPDGAPLWGGARFTAGDQRLLDSLTQRFATTP